MIISDHAHKEMKQSGVSEEEVQQCLKHMANLKLDKLSKAKQDTARRQKDEERVITAYVIRRKKKW